MTVTPGLGGYPAGDFWNLVSDAGELWNSTWRTPPALSAVEQEALDLAARVYQGEIAAEMDEDGEVPDFPVAMLEVVVRAAGLLWQATGGHDPYDVLSGIQRERLNLAAAIYRAGQDGSDESGATHASEGDGTP